MNSPVRFGVSPAAATPTGFFSQSFWGFISPGWNPGLCGLSRFPVVPPGLSTHKCGTIRSTSHCLAGSARYCLVLSAHHHLAASTLHPACPSPPLLPVWMNVSSLTPWLSDFHRVQFYGNSYCFLFLNFLLPFFWLWEEAECIYLHCAGCRDIDF